MNNLNLKPAMRYQMSYMWKSFITVFGIAMAVVTLVMIFFSVNIADGEAHILFFQITQDGAINTVIHFNMAAVMLFMFFIVGVSGIREDLRFYLQNGLSRRTVYASTVLSSAASGLGVGFISALFNLTGSILPGFPVRGFMFSDLQTYTALNFIGDLLLHTLCFFLAWQLGSLISLIYYRLGKIQQVVFSVLGIAILIFGLPFSLAAVITRADFETLGAAFSSTLFIGIILLLVSILTAVGNFLLLRRAPLK